MARKKTYLILIVKVLLCMFCLSAVGQEYVFVKKWPEEIRGLRNPGGVAVDSSGNVYVADTNNHRIQVFSPDISLILTNRINALGYEVKKDDFGNIDQGQTSSQYAFSNDKAQNLAFGLNWAGSILKLSVYRPDGSLFEEAQGTPQVIIEVENAEVGDWKYTVTGVDVPVNDYPYVVQVGAKQAVGIPLKAGWNMVSFPGTLANPSVESLIPQGSSIIPPFYTYDPASFSYKEVNEVKSGEGYWILSMAEEAINADLAPATSLALSLKPGWNMIGGVNGSVDFSVPKDDPDGSVILPIYTYNPAIFGYDEKASIETCVGYWVLALQEYALTLNSGAAPPRSKAIKAYAAEPDWVVPFQLRGIKEIALGVQSGASDSFEPYMDKAMPPRAGMASNQPEIAFLVNDRLVTHLSRDIRGNETDTVWYMEVESSGGTELTWDISSLPIDRDMSLQFAGIDISMRNQRSIIVPSGRHAIAITLKDRIPTKPELLQNYPNPFNPETWIPYQLSESGKVVISIYDVNGRLMRKLDLGYKEAGMYVSREKSAYWDGRNEVRERVSSGIYFYQIQSGRFSKVMKLVVVR